MRRNGFLSVLGSFPPKPSATLARGEEICTYTEEETPTETDRQTVKTDRHRARELESERERILHCVFFFSLSLSPCSILFDYSFLS